MHELIWIQVIVVIIMLMIPLLHEGLPLASPYASAFSRLHPVLATLSYYIIWPIDFGPPLHLLPLGFQLSTPFAQLSDALAACPTQVNFDVSMSRNTSGFAWLRFLPHEVDWIQVFHHYLTINPNYSFFKELCQDNMYILFRTIVEVRSCGLMGSVFGFGSGDPGSIPNL